MALAYITFREAPPSGGQPVDLAQTTAGVVPDVGQMVTLESPLYGRRRYRVVAVTHQYVETARQVNAYKPGQVLVDMEQEVCRP